MTEVAVQVKGLQVEVEGGFDIVDGISFEVAEGEVVGLVGGSGCGKSTVAHALLAHSRRGTRIASGSINIAGHDIVNCSTSEVRRLRGRTISYVPQDPSIALNPALRIEGQLLEVLTTHKYLDNDRARRERLEEMLDEALLPNDEEFLRRYPHQLSGGQQQRVVLAMAFACRPAVIVLDEPTTGLDVTTQKHVLSTVRNLCKRHSVAALYITHDLAVVAGLADRVMVMYAGAIVESAPRQELFGAPRHPYTFSLIRAIPDISGNFSLVVIPGRPPSPGERPPGCCFEPQCPLAIDKCRVKFPPEEVVGEKHWVRCYRANDVLAQSRRHAPRSQDGDGRPKGDRPLLSVRNLSASYGKRQVLHDVRLDVQPGACLAVVGESGSGKTTLARCIAGLRRQWHGEIRFEGISLETRARDRDRHLRQKIQYVFQNPYTSLNPRWTVRDIVAQPLHVFGNMGRGETDRQVGDALERAALDSALMYRYPDQLSGGERQRVAIARALVVQPDLLICDEVTSALDVSVQAAIVNLLDDLRRRLRMSLLFVTHNLPLVGNIAQEVVVLSKGRIVESGDVETVLQIPHSDYAKKLLADSPSLDAVMRNEFWTEE